MHVSAHVHYYYIDTPFQVFIRNTMVQIIRLNASFYLTVGHDLFTPNFREDSDTLALIPRDSKT